MNMLSTERTTVRKTGEQGIMVRNMLGTFEIFITPGMTKEHAAGKLMFLPRVMDEHAGNMSSRVYYIFNKKV